MANTNKTLIRAGAGKNDEFYTQLGDIENELRHYKDYFPGKTVFCNCDDPYESNFFRYFAMNFNVLGLKKLIATCYATSPISYTQLDLFGNVTEVRHGTPATKPYKIEITEVKDENGDGAVNLAVIPDHILYSYRITETTTHNMTDYKETDSTFSIAVPDAFFSTCSSLPHWRAGRWVTLLHRKRGHYPHTQGKKGWNCLSVLLRKSGPFQTFGAKTSTVVTGERSAAGICGSAGRWLRQAGCGRDRHAGRKGIWSSGQLSVRQQFWR